MQFFSESVNCVDFRIFFWMKRIAFALSLDTPRNSRLFLQPLARVFLSSTTRRTVVCNSPCIACHRKYEAGDSHMINGGGAVRFYERIDRGIDDGTGRWASVWRICDKKFRQHEPPSAHQRSRRDMQMPAIMQRSRMRHNMLRRPLPATRQNEINRYLSRGARELHSRALSILRDLEVAARDASCNPLSASL